jgi:DNA-binding Xre family transcriptional regulator
MNMCLRIILQVLRQEQPKLSFSARHWQQIEAGRPITLTTLLRICEALDVRLTTMLAGLDRQSKR